MNTIPEDFSFRYSFTMGSVPPPYYYEYTIRVKPDGGGVVELTPDYPANRPDKRIANIQVDRPTMEYLYEEMQSAGLFDKPCQAVDSNWVGGSQSSLNVQANGKEHRVPFAISIADTRRMEPVFLAIQELLPPKLTSGLSV